MSYSDVSKSSIASVQSINESNTKRGGNWIILATVASLFIDLISFTLILPLFPSILEHYKNDDKSGLYPLVARSTRILGRAIGTPSSQPETILIGGVLGSVFCFLQYISSPIIGAIADAKGRRVSLLSCLVGIIGSHLIWYASQDFATFVLARVIGGIARANVSICYSIIADDSSPESRPKGMALVGGAFSLGFTLGPAIGAYFAKVRDFSTPALISVLLSTISFLMVFLFVPETLPPEKRAKKSKLSRNLSITNYFWPTSLFRFSAVSTGRSLIPLGVTYFIYIFFFSGLEFTLTFLTHQKLGYTPKDQGKMFMFIGITMTFIQGILTRRLKEGLEGSASMFGMFIMVPAFTLVGLATEPFMLYSGLFLYSFGTAIVGPCLTSLAASKVKVPNENGVAMGIFRSLGALARSFGPIVAAGLYWSCGAEFAYSLGGIAFFIPLFLLRNQLMSKDKQN